MVLKTCKWYQTVCLVMTRRLVPSMTFQGQTLKLTYLGHYVPCYLLWPLVTSILTWPNKVFFFTKVVRLSTNYQMSFAVCHRHDDSWFSRSDGGAEKAPTPPPDSEPFRAHPELGYNYKTLRNQYLKWFKRKLETNNKFLKAWQRFQCSTWNILKITLPMLSIIHRARQCHWPDRQTIHSSSLSFSSFTYHYRPFRAGHKPDDAWHQKPCWTWILSRRTEGLAHGVEIYASNADIRSQTR